MSRQLLAVRDIGETFAIAPNIIIKVSTSICPGGPAQQRQKKSLGKNKTGPRFAKWQMPSAGSGGNFIPLPLPQPL